MGEIKLKCQPDFLIVNPNKKGAIISAAGKLIIVDSKGKVLSTHTVSGNRKFVAFWGSSRRILLASSSKIRVLSTNGK